MLHCWYIFWITNY